MTTDTVLTLAQAKKAVDNLRAGTYHKGQAENVADLITKSVSLGLLGTTPEDLARLVEKAPKELID